MSFESVFWGRIWIQKRNCSCWTKLRVTDVEPTQTFHPELRHCREGQAWLQLLTVLSSLLSAGCGRSPVWASVAGKHPGCRKHCWTPAKREDTDTPRDITADINAEWSQNTACEFKIRRKAAVLAGCCKSETQTSKKTPVISGLRTSPFSLAC